MKLIRFRLVIAALAVLLGSAIARSQTTADAPATPPAHAHHHGYGMEFHRMGFFGKDLNLTDDQRTQVKAIMQKEHTAMKPLFQQSHQIELQLRQYSEGTYDEAKVRTLAAQKSQAEVELTVARTRLQSELFQLLTPDQQAKQKEMEAAREARMQQHMQKAAPAPPSE